MITTNYYKNLLGFKGQVFVAAAIEYTAQATLAAFQTNAVAGEFGVFNADTGALISGLANVATNVRIIFASKRQQAGKAAQLYKSTPFTVGELTKKTRTAYAAGVNQVTTLSTFPAAPVAGTTYQLTILDETPGAEPFPTFLYNYTAKTGETTATLIAAFAALIGNASSYQHKNRDLIVSVASNATTLTLTALSPYTKFKVLPRTNLQGIVTVTATTAPFIGVGTPAMVTALEEAGNAYHGITTNYPQNGVPSEYGKPDSLVSSTGQYNIYEFKFPRTERVVGPVGKWDRDNTIVVAVCANGAANAEAEVKLIFAL